MRKLHYHDEGVCVVCGSVAAPWGTKVNEGKETSLLKGY